MPVAAHLVDVAALAGDVELRALQPRIDVREGRRREPASVVHGGLRRELPRVGDQDGAAAEVVQRHHFGHGVLLEDREALYRPDPDPRVPDQASLPAVGGFERDLGRAGIAERSVAIPGCGALPAFPGAEGFGAMASGGRGGVVLQVTNLNDSGPGSLRAAILASGPRIVVFRVGGTIELLTRIDISNPDITIAGQTAPGGGITLKNHPSNTRSPLKVETDNVILRYIRSRPGPSDLPSATLDALTIEGHRVIIDHCSLSWATDEVLNTWLDSSEITIQWTIIAEGLEDSNHPDGPHSRGALLGDHSTRVSVHHCLFAHSHYCCTFAPGCY